MSANHVTLDDDVAAAVGRTTARDENLGLSEAVNRPARAGLERAAQSRAHRHHTADLGLTVDVRRIGDVLDMLDDEAR